MTVEKIRNEKKESEYKRKTNELCKEEIDVTEEHGHTIITIKRG